MLREAAKLMGVDVFTLIHWEKGKTEPAIRLWPAIISFLGYDPSPCPATLGDHVRAERRRRGCSLAALAREVGFDEATLSLIEADKYPRIDVRVRQAHTALQQRFGLADLSVVDCRQISCPALTVRIERRRQTLAPGVPARLAIAAGLL